MFWGIFVLKRVSILSLFVLIRVSILSIFVLIRVSFLGRKTSCAYVLRTKLHRVWCRVKRLKQGIKNGNSVLNRVGKSAILSAIFVLNRVRVWGAGPHLPIQGYIEYPPPPGGSKTCLLCFFNYWMRLSIVWRIMEIEERPKWITLSEITIILQMIRRPNWI